MQLLKTFMLPRHVMAITCNTPNQPKIWTEWVELNIQLDT